MRGGNTARQLRGLAVGLVVAGLAIAAAGDRAAHLQPAVESSTTQTGQAAPVPTATMVDGLPVLSVSEVLSERAAGKLKSGPLAVTGRWTAQNTGTWFCAWVERPMWLQPGAGCGGWLVMLSDLTVGTMDSLSPAISPNFLDARDLGRYDMAGLTGGQPAIAVAIGHFDDPAAAFCIDSDVCRNRLVLDRVVSFTGGITFVCVPRDAVMTDDDWNDCLEFDDVARSAAPEAPGPIAGIEILVAPHPCGYPSPTTTPCLPGQARGTAYVFFAGSPDVEALRLVDGPGGSTVARLLGLSLPSEGDHHVAPGAPPRA